MKSLNMYIPIRDETNFMIKYYQYLFNKYWGKHVQVYFLGYKQPGIDLEENIHFVSLAEKRDPSPSSWSAPIIDFFESIDDEYFHFSLEDLLIIRPVDLHLIEVCKDMMSPTVGRIDLWNSVQYDPFRRGWVEFYKERSGVKFCIQKQNPPPRVYRVSCSNSIWNREWFLKTLEKGWSTGDWEHKGNLGRVNNDGYDVLSTIDRWTPTVVHSLCRHWSGKINTYGMFENDKKQLLKMSTKEERKRFSDTLHATTVINLNFNDPLRNFWDFRFLKNNDSQDWFVGAGNVRRSSPDDDELTQGYQPNIGHTSNIKETK